MTTPHRRVPFQSERRCTLVSHSWEPPGLGTVEDFTALGDAVNTTARLASAAGAGEVIVSIAAAEAAHTRLDGLERRTVPIRGRTEPIEVVVLRHTVREKS